MSTNKQTNKGQPAADKPAQSEFPICQNASEIKFTLARFGVDSALYIKPAVKRPAVKVPRYQHRAFCDHCKASVTKADIEQHEQWCEQYRKDEATRIAKRRAERQVGPLPGCSPLGLKPAAVKVTSRRVKAAWIRRQDVPAGEPATGHFACECGRVVPAGFYGQGPAVSCECGIVYDNRGWIQGPGGL